MATRKIKSGMGIDSYDPTQALLDEDRIGRAIWECLKEGDAEGVIEIIQIHLDAVNRTQDSRERELESVLHSSFRNKNPTIRTLAKAVHAYA